MSDRVFDSTCDALEAAGAFHVAVPMPPPEDRFFAVDPHHPDAPEFELDTGTDGAEVERAIREFHAQLLRLFVSAGVPGGDEQGYVVLRDGRWHPDVVQAYLMRRRQPHLTPREWVDRKLDADGVGIVLDESAVPEQLKRRCSIEALRSNLGKLLSAVWANSGRDVTVEGEPFGRARLFRYRLTVTSGDPRDTFHVDLGGRTGRAVLSIEMANVPRDK